MIISEVGIPNISFSQAQATATLSTFLEQQSNVSELRSKLLPLEKSFGHSFVYSRVSSNNKRFLFWSLSVSVSLFFINICDNLYTCY